MTGRPALIVRVDARHETGLGHAVRTSRLLTQLDADIAVTVIGGGDALASLFPDAALFPAEPTAGEAVLRAARETGAGAVLIDEPAPDPELWAALERAPALQRVVIDDFGADIAADLVLNGTVIEAHHRYPQLRPGGEALCGGAYALTSPAFAASRHDGPRPGPVVAVCGGGDRAARWALALADAGPDLARGRGFHLIVGAAYPGFDRLARVAAASGATLERGVSADALAARLSAAPAAIVTGGMIAYEVLAAGVPALVFPQIDNLVEEIAWFAARGGLIDLGFDGGEDLDRLGAELDRLLGDPEAARALSEAGPRLIDGQGLVRAATALAARLRTPGVSVSPAISNPGKDDAS